jgi:hypothetical protein
MAGNVLSSDKETIPARYAKMPKRKFSWRMASCYCLSWKHSNSALAHCTLVKCFDVFSLCSSRTVCRSHQYGCRSSPHRARQAITLAAIILWFVNCRLKSTFCVYGTCRRYMKIQSSHVLNHGASWQCVANFILRPVCPYRMLRTQPIE